MDRQKRLHTEVKRLSTQRKPAASSRGEFGWFGKLGQPQKLATEGSSAHLLSGRHGKLKVV